MKVLFIVPYPTEGPSNRFRVEQYLPELKRQGISYTVRPFCNTALYKILWKKSYYLKKFSYLLYATFLRFLDIMRSPKYDVVFIHREAFPTKGCVFEWLFRKFAKKIIYDFDDSVFLKKSKKVEFTVSSADYVITGNRFLKDYALNFNKRVKVVPTCIDTDKYRPLIKAKSKEKIVLGWIGTPTTAVYLDDLQVVFNTLSNKYKNIIIKIIGSKFNNDSGLPITNKDWALGDEVKDLQEFDVGIMPMPDNNWTKGKCAFKIIQYMAVGVPAVASPVGMNKEVINSDVNGLLASSEKEWCEKLSALIESPELRIMLAENGRKTIEESFSLKVNAPKFINVLKETTKGI